MSGNNLLRRAVDSEPVPGDLEARVRARLEPSAFSGWGRLVSSLALLAIVAGGLEVAAFRKTHTLLRVGVDDHLHCAIAATYPHQSDKAEMARDLGPYSVMLQPVLDQMQGDLAISAHRCTVNGRTYVHFILRHGGLPVSVILTRRTESEKFPPDISARVVHVSGIPVREDRLNGYSVGGFEAGGYLGYVVSGLPAPENDALAEKIAPVIRRYTGT